MIHPPKLKKGDKIGLLSTSNKTTESEIRKAEEIIQGWGLVTVRGKTIGLEHESFAGNDEQRLKDLQQMLDDDEIKCILQTMGGYGIVRIIDRLDFTQFKYQPKWIAGYSDTTFLHGFVQGMLNTTSIQSTMPTDLSVQYYKNSWESLRKALFGEELDYRIKPHPLNRLGKSMGPVTGGNLSILCNIRATTSDINTNGTILFIEETSEHMFHLDGYIMALKRANKLTHLKGLLVGAFTDVKEDDPPFGCTVEELIRSRVEEYDFPICFGFPAGHEGEHNALILGGIANLEVGSDGARLRFEKHPIE
jgi:muramoyltetrapeptide carboxypeptidase